MKTLKVYKGDELVGSQEASSEGTTTVTISNLEADTTYPKGTFKLSWEEEGRESDKVDVPKFTTRPLITSMEFPQKEYTVAVGDFLDMFLNFEPPTAEGKYIYDSDNENIFKFRDLFKSLAEAVSVGQATITATATDGSNLTATAIVNVVPKQ